MPAGSMRIDRAARGRRRTGPPDRLIELIGSCWKTQVVHVAAELGVADALAPHPLRADELACALRCDARSLSRLLRALASIGLCEQLDDGTFGLTATGALLRSNTSDSLRSWAVWWGRHLWPTWGNLLHSTRTGKSARTLATGKTGYAHVEGDPQAAEVFNAAMSAVTRLIAHDVAALQSIAGARIVLDVGGGQGELLTAILAHHRGLRGLLLDRPHAVEGARAGLQAAGLQRRCEVVAGDFFDAVPAGADVVLLKSVLHNWTDDRCEIILGNCRRAMAASGTLIVIERVMPKRSRECSAHQALARSDLNMLVGLGGRERTQTEWRSLLRRSGFAVSRVRPLSHGLSVIQAARFTAASPMVMAGSG
jgi:hypothetical protein